MAALFDIDEIVRGNRLGSGAFSHVNEIDAFVLREERDTDDLTEEHHKAREMFASNATNDNGVPRFAIKIIQPAMMNDENDFRLAAGGLANEEDILSKLDHPNIIKLRGYPSDGVRAYVRTERYDGYFLILDRLDETLSDRIVSWKREAKRLKNPVAFLKQSSRKHDLLLERLTAARDIASALAYLHSNRIIYRDIKSDNIGFDESGSLKLFDFGLSRPLPRNDDDDDDDMSETFEMSGRVGTKLYMAPEVYERRKYNTSADVYSYSLLLWEILAMQRPFPNYTKKMYKVRVVKRGERPQIDNSWPLEIKEIIRKAWSRDMDERPTMQEVCQVLDHQIEKIKAAMNNKTYKMTVGFGKSKRKDLVPNRIVPSAA